MASDLISRDALLKALKHYSLSYGSSLGRHSGIAEIFLYAIEEAPSVDAVEVVRCKDCENWDTDWCPSHSAKGEHWCGMIDLVTEPDFFCGYGERKKEDAVD